MSETSQLRVDDVPVEILSMLDAVSMAAGSAQTQSDFQDSEQQSDHRRLGWNGGGMTCATLTQAQINQRMRPWGDAEIRRFTFRHALFRQRGLSDHAAEALGDRLALRDQDKDDGRICLECKHIKPQLRCAHNQAVLSDLLWRCHHFDFEKPTQ